MEFHKKRLTFPFSAIAGQEMAKFALLCTAVDPLIGGVLLKGDKGTGKSTLVRALANILPEIEVIADCSFNCNPKNLSEMCDSCYERYERGETLPITKRRMKLVNLPLSVTMDRLIGTVDVEHFLKEGKKALQPGILAEANRGILYIDEANLLDDYIADSLLDATALGWSTIEREGISFRHPARFILVGSMNPEEGDLRPQILDRFGLCVEVSASMNPEERIEIVKRVEEFNKDPIDFYKKYENEEKNLTEKIIKARELLPKVKVGDDLFKLLAETVINLGIKTHRAEITTIKTAKAIAALNERRKVSLEDLEKAMELTLPHRLKEKPFQKPPQIKPSESKENNRQDHNHKDNHDNEPKKENSSQKSPQIKSSEPKKNNKQDHNHKDNHNHEPKKEKKNEKTDKRNQGSQSQEEEGNLEQNFYSSEAKIPRTENINFDGGEFTGYRSSRDISTTVINFPKGIPVSYLSPANESLKDVDFYNSLVWAVLNGKKLPMKLDSKDIRIRVRRTKAPTLWVLILDSSGSMAVQKRISIAKGIAKKLVENGYIKKSKIALIIARGNQSKILVPPTKNYWEVFEKIESVPTGGRTPLSSALHNLWLLARRERMKDKSVKVRAFLITDGKANVPLFGKRIKDEIVELANTLKKKDIKLNIYNTNSNGINPGISYIPVLKKIVGAKVYGV